MNKTEDVYGALGRLGMHKKDIIHPFMDKPDHPVAPRRAEEEIVDAIYSGIASRVNNGDCKIQKEDIADIVDSVMAKRDTDNNYVEGISRVLETALYAKIRLGKPSLAMTVNGDSMSLFFPDAVKVEAKTLFDFIRGNKAHLMGTWDCPMTYSVESEGSKTVVKFKFK